MGLTPFLYPAEYEAPQERVKQALEAIRAIGKEKVSSSRAQEKKIESFSQK